MATTYGFQGLEDVTNDLVVDVGETVVMNAIIEDNAEYNEQINAALSVFTERTTMKSERILLPGDGTLQPLDEWGNPKPVEPSGFYEVGYPIYGGGTAWGDNRVSRALMTVMQAQRNTLDAQRRDRDWMRRHLLAAWFTNTTRTYTDPQYPTDPTVTVQPLALTSDGVVYTRKAGTVATTDQHYLAQANAIGANDDPYGIIYEDLDEHSSNSGPYVAYIPQNQVSATVALAAVYPPDDPNLIWSVDTTRSRVSVDTDFSEYGTSPTGVGGRYLGRHESGLHIVEWTALPDDYIVAHSVGAGPFMKMREYPSGALQGFFPEMHSPDGNQMVNRFIRYAGFGVSNRVAALAYRIGNASYAIPSGFTAPLAV